MAVAHAPSSLRSFSDNSDIKAPKFLVSNLTWRKQSQMSHPRSAWRPNAYQLFPLVTIVIVSWVLIIVLQLLLTKSQREGGIIIANTIDDIPLSTSFLYLYLPTIVALVFSFFWSWIDLQIKRLEPYYQLSKPDGAWGKDSLLLSYPYDFLPFVPLSAFRRKYDHSLQFHIQCGECMLTFLQALGSFLGWHVYHVCNVGRCPYSSRYILL